MKKLLAIFSSILMLLAFAGCTDTDNDVKIEEENKEEPEVLTELTLSPSESRAAEQIQGFNSAFFKAVVNANPSEPNVVCSPLSASVLLSMVANAAEGDLSREITEALDCRDLEALNSLSYKYLHALPTIDPAVTFAAANAVWHNHIYSIAPEFAKISQKYYDAPTFARDFSNSPAVIEEINEWCKNNTDGIIEKMIDELPANAVSVLANAIYFKGQWGIPFDKKETEEMPFNGLNGPTSVDMMHKTAYQHYLEADDFEAVKMQIGSGKFEAYFILPKADLQSFLADADFEQIVNANYTDLLLSYFLPRFKYSPNGSMSLNDILADMGIKSLKTISSLSMFLPKVEAFHNIFQQTGVEFNEEGAKGASVTMNMMVTSAGPDSSYVPKIKVVKFDRPFVFMIRETTTGAMLFAGKISDL